jgi:2-dehydropantoate 2-reductase
LSHVSDPDLPTVAVVGPGAIGTTVAAALHQRGMTPLIVGRTARPGLQLDTDDGSVVVPGPVLTDPTTVDSPVDVVFLAVKATQTADAARWLRVLCSPETVVCVLQNGIEQEDAVAPLVPGSTVVPAVVWFPAVRAADDSVRLLADARLTLPDVPAASVVQRLLLGTLCTVEVADDFRSTAWRKLLQNAAAGLMVLTGRRSGVFRRDDLGGLALAYLREAIAVARADGAHLDDDVPQQILGGFRAAPADQGTSILTDREAGRPLEWDVRNGVVQRRGRALGVPTPISDVIVPLLAAASDELTDSLSVSVPTTSPGPAG